MAGNSTAARIVASGGTVETGEISDFYPGLKDPHSDSLELGPNVTYHGRRTMHVGGDVSLGGAHLDRDGWGTVIEKEGSGAVAGIFAGLPEGSIFECLEGWSRITYAGGTGNDVVLLAQNAGAIPALGPLALVIVAIALAAVGLLRATAS